MKLNLNLLLLQKICFKTYFPLVVEMLFVWFVFNGTWAILKKLIYIMHMVHCSHLCTTCGWLIMEQISESIFELSSQYESYMYRGFPEIGCFHCNIFFRKYISMKYQHISKIQFCSKPRQCSEVKHLKALTFLLGRSTHVMT